MAAPTVFRSTDASAPTLSGTVGDLINLLDKCLVSGYGSKTALGWTKPYTGTNKAVFRAPAGPQHYLYVDDNASGAGGAKEALARGWEAMFSIADTADPVNGTTGPYPTDAQQSGGIVIRKSTAASATTRDWILIGDTKTFYLFIKAEVAVGAAGVYFGFMFGAIHSYSTGGDSYCSAIIGRTTQNTSTLLAGTDALGLLMNGQVTAPGGNYIARSVAGLGGSLAFSKYGDGTKANQALTTHALYGGVPYPNGPDGGLYIAPVYVWEPIQGATSMTVVRGRLRGFYHQCHAIASFADGDTFSGATSGVYTGKTFLLIKQSAQNATPLPGVYCIETTEWDS